MTKNEAGLQAIELFKNKAKLCDSRPSKVARSHEGPGRASASSSATSSASASSSALTITSDPSTSKQPAGATATINTALSAPVLKQADADLSSVPSTSSLSTPLFNQATITSPSRSRSSTVKPTTQAVAAG